MSIKFNACNSIKYPSSIYAGINGSVRDVKSVYVGNSNNKAVKVWGEDGGKLICNVTNNSAACKFVSYDGVQWEAYNTNNCSGPGYCFGYTFYDKLDDNFITIKNRYLCKSKDGVITDDVIQINSLDGADKIDSNMLTLDGDGLCIFDDYIFLNHGHCYVYMIKRKQEVSILDNIVELNNWELLDGLPLQYRTSTGKYYLNQYYQTTIGNELIFESCGTSKSYYCKLSDMAWKEVDITGVQYCCFFKGLFIISASTLKTFLYSTDCINWQECNFDITGTKITNTRYFKFEILNDRIYAYSNGYFSYSYDGINWVNPILMPYTIYDIIYFNKKYIMSCNGGYIYYSSNGENFSDYSKISIVTSSYLCANK